MCCNAIITTHIIIDNIYRKRSNEQEHQPASPCHLETFQQLNLTTIEQKLWFKNHQKHSKIMSPSRGTGAIVI